MASAIIDQVAVDIKNNENNIIFRANGSSIKFKGMLSVYSEAKDEDEGNNNQNSNLPILDEKDLLNFINSEKRQHFTLPPPQIGRAHV